MRYSFGLALALSLGLSSAGLAETTLLTNVTIVDVETGRLADRSSVLIRDSMIVEVGDDIPAGDAVLLDAGGGYLIPGLWDSHVHIFSTPTEPDTALPLYLLNGVTGIRDMGALWPIAEQKALQTRIEAGEVAGPRLILSGAWVDASPGSWPGMFLADTPEEARAVVDRIAAEGWAAVKSYSMLDEPTYLGLAAAAKDHGLPLVGHVPERVSLGTAIAAGQAGIEHFGRIPMACSTREAEMLDDLRRVMAEGAELAQVFEVMAARNRIVLESWDAGLCQGVLADLNHARAHDRGRGRGCRLPARPLRSGQDPASWPFLGQLPWHPGGCCGARPLSRLCRYGADQPSASFRSHGPRLSAVHLQQAWRRSDGSQTGGRASQLGGRPFPGLAAASRPGDARRRGGEHACKPLGHHRNFPAGLACSGLYNY